jgi:putative sugar O-methyltransferase
LWDYVVDLPEEAYEKLRLHTYHFTGDNYQRYLERVGAEQFSADWAALSSMVPEEYRLHEPGNGIGFDCADGRFVSADVMRFQEVVNAFHASGLLEELRRKPRNLVLEIGAGYGGLIYQLSSLFSGTFVVVDLPETLLFSASYITMNRPESRIYVYDPATFDEAVRSLDRYDFFFVPNFRLSALRTAAFDLVLNLASLQEMREDQVREYLDFIRATLRGTFFSWNVDRHPRNTELTNVNALLRTTFDARELSTRGLKARKPRSARQRVARFLRSAAKRLDPPADAGSRMRYRMFLCRPRAGATTQRP